MSSLRIIAFVRLGVPGLLSLGLVASTALAAPVPAPDPAGRVVWACEGEYPDLGRILVELRRMPGREINSLRLDVFASDLRSPARPDGRIARLRRPEVAIVGRTAVFTGRDVDVDVEFTLEEFEDGARELWGSLEYRRDWLGPAPGIGLPLRVELSCVRG